MKPLKWALVLLMLMGLACEKSTLTDDELLLANDDSTSVEGILAKGTVVQKTPILPFQPAGEFGGPTNQLIPGTFFPPAGNNKASLKRGKNYLQFNLHTTGLPMGAYTVWWVIFNDPPTCTGPGAPGGVCGEADLFNASAAIVWATGKVVKANGVGNFSDRIYVGEQRSETIVLGANLEAPLAYPKDAEVHLIVKYHGLASEDPDVLYAQLNTLLGNCGVNDGANSYDAGPFGIQCFDPQFAIFGAN